MTTTQLVLRIAFYAAMAYGVILLAQLIKKKQKSIKKKGVSNCTMYIIISTILLIVLGNIIIFNVDMYDALIGPLNIHVLVYLVLIIGGYTAIYFLKAYVKEL